MRLIASLFSMRVMTEEGRGAIGETFQKIMNEDLLWKKFLDCSKSSLLVTMKRKIYDKLVS